MAVGSDTLQDLWDQVERGFDAIPTWGFVVLLVALLVWGWHSDRGRGIGLGDSGRALAGAGLAVLGVWLALGIAFLWYTGLVVIHTHLWPGGPQSMPEAIYDVVWIGTGLVLSARPTAAYASWALSRPVVGRHLRGPAAAGTALPLIAEDIGEASANVRNRWGNWLAASLVLVALSLLLLAFP